MKLITLDNLQRFCTKLIDLLSNKQDKLIDGVNISTINGTSILNGGNIDISAEHGTLVYDNLPTSGSNNLVSSGGIYNSLENTKNEIYNALTPVTLFESSTPSYDDITLSDSVANYDTIEVFGVLLKLEIKKSALRGELQNLQLKFLVCHCL